LVLLQVGLDVETSAVCIAVLLFRQTNIFFFVVNFNFIFSIGQRFRAGRYKISHLQQYLPVVGNFYRRNLFLKIKHMNKTNFLTFITIFFILTSFGQNEVMISNQNRFEVSYKAQKLSEGSKDKWLVTVMVNL